MPAAQFPAQGARLILLAAVLLGACGKVTPKDEPDAGKARAEARRQKSACASSAAYARLKGILFDQATAQHQGDQANLDILADYSSVRMEDPVVVGWDPALDITQCRGRLILEMPPGAERGFGGERRLQAGIDYTAQAAADGNGFVYRLTGAAPIVTRLAAFDLTSGAYSPPPAIDERRAEAAPSEDAKVAATDMAGEPSSGDRATQATPERPAAVAPRPTIRTAAIGDSGEATVRAFYRALGAGDGAAASAQIVPEKRSSGAYSPAAITRFYGPLPEPLRLGDIVPLESGGYRVRYRYSAGRSHCDGAAIVRLANRGGRDLIRSIEALNGC